MSDIDKGTVVAGLLAAADAAGLVYIYNHVRQLEARVKSLEDEKASSTIAMAKIVEPLKQELAELRYVLAQTNAPRQQFIPNPQHQQTPFQHIMGMSPSAQAIHYHQQSPAVNQQTHHQQSPSFMPTMMQQPTHQQSPSFMPTMMQQSTQQQMRSPMHNPTMQTRQITPVLGDNDIAADAQIKVYGASNNSE